MSAFGSNPNTPDAQAATRAREWQAALEADRLPGFVTTRLKNAAAGRTPWLSTMTPAELLLSRSHGIRPIATVSGTCWYHFGWSWTEGHAEGWHKALGRLKDEAIAAGANAVLDVKLRTTRLHGTGSSMDYTVVGTAVAIEGLPPSPDPVIATVPAIEFVRLLEAGIVTTGLAIGARYGWLTSGWSTLGWFGRSADLPELTNFWEGIRRQALQDLRRDAAPQGNGVLAHTHFSQIFKVEQNNQTPQILGRHIVLGTVVQTSADRTVPHTITPVVDMRDQLSPLRETAPRSHTAYGAQADEEGPI
ncbi:heavy metal-binding domain-containing protein [Lichenifustis flavocetrariae]|uniref:Heavy metal-binding domain-containing protein n=1 Tax=Lichenifustis flavocetrariae TaxID=2949735 RepID=A0AA41Z4T5_9HYPH|nr:heavy metal-binding domain-containing protein [Lichenifustis flavocetrariae]MCW6512958.1 heavy metal-binding domain-containing protein [Lichenifustis flavocetrariae]